MLANSKLPIPDRYACGVMLPAIYARARSSDLSQIHLIAPMKGLRSKSCRRSLAVPPAPY